MFVVQSEGCACYTQTITMVKSSVLKLSFRWSFFFLSVYFKALTVNRMFSYPKRSMLSGGWMDGGGSEGYRICCTWQTANVEEVFDLKEFPNSLGIDVNKPWNEIFIHNICQDKYNYELTKNKWCWLVGWLIGWVLWHINLCRLFNAKSIFM